MDREELCAAVALGCALWADRRVLPLRMHVQDFVQVALALLSEASAPGAAHRICDALMGWQLHFRGGGGASRVLLNATLCVDVCVPLSGCSLGAEVSTRYAWRLLQELNQHPSLLGARQRDADAETGVWPRTHDALLRLTRFWSPCRRH